MLVNYYNLARYNRKNDVHGFYFHGPEMAKLEFSSQLRSPEFVHRPKRTYEN